MLKLLLSVALGVCSFGSAMAGEATEVTTAQNEALVGLYPFDDEQDFQDAIKGQIAPLPDNGVVKDADGKVVWDLSRFAEVIGADPGPSTVNPSLWRQAQLLMISGLFEVVPGVYQVRGADLSNMTIVEGKKGITIYDPLISAETAKYALDLYYAHRPQKPVVAVVFSHSHVDHFGGVAGVVDPDRYASGKTKIYAPAGFLENAISENVFAGNAMSRRATYMYGNLLPPGPDGMMTAGLGVTTSTGQVTILKPTDLISTTGERHKLDGIEYIFVSAPGSEAPSEMMWYLPKFKLISTAEDSTHTMHNLYTLRGAKTRDASKWPRYLNQVLQMFGADAEVEIAMHHWPTWGNDRVVAHIKSQRDTYKYMHDQTLRMANKGYTINEMPGLVSLPDTLVNTWSAHGYYGSLSHNVRAVYNFYLGYFDGNPSHLDPLPPADVATRYVAAIGGAEAVMAVGQAAFDSGDYRWGAEVMNHLVFAEPDNQPAKNLLANILEQLGYQAESGPWRNFYLTGALELRNGIAKLPAPETSSIGILEQMDLMMIFDMMAIQLDPEKAAGKELTLHWVFPDTGERYVVFLENSVINAWPNASVSAPDVRITVNRSTLNKVLSQQLAVPDGLKSGVISVDGDQDKLLEFLGCLDGSTEFWFPIVTP